MANLNMQFNPMAFNPAQGSGVLPVGRHMVEIYASEVKATASNDGGYLQLDLRILEGEHAGATGPYRLNLFNKNEKAVEIASKSLSAVCHVVGHLSTLTDSQQLHGKPFVVEVVPQKDKPEYTEVKRVFDANGNEPGKGGGNPQQAAPQQMPAEGPGQGGAPASWGSPQQVPQDQAQQQVPQGSTGQPSSPWGGQQSAPQQAPQQTPPWGGNGSNQGGAPWGS